MKKLFLFLIVIALFFIPVKSSAVQLVCDIPSDLSFTATVVSVDGAEMPGVMDAGPDGPVIRIYTDENNIDWMVLLDEQTMAGLEVGRHNFLARLVDPSGWPGDWSDPLNAGKPGTLGNVKVVN